MHHSNTLTAVGSIFLTFVLSRAPNDLYMAFAGHEASFVKINSEEVLCFFVILSSFVLD
jgi:hypothetical protein